MIEVIVQWKDNDILMYLIKYLKLNFVHKMLQEKNRIMYIKCYKKKIELCT